MHSIDTYILHSYFILHLMKKKKLYHPKLFTNIEIKDNCITLFFVENTFNEYGKRLVNDNTIQIDDKINCVQTYILNKNEIEYDSLIKYIKIQKKVLQKHQKARNYDSSRVVKYSILVMENFKDEFDDWFKINRVS